MKSLLRFAIMLTLTAALCLCLGTAVYAGDTVPPDPVIHTVTLDANGGYFDDDPANTVKVFQVMYGMDLYSPIPTNPNPHLACSGWYYDEACTQLAAGFIDGRYESYTPNSDATLYAGWTEAWVVTFDANGGTLESGNTYSVAKGNRLAYQPFLRPADPNRMRFSHWALADGTRVNTREYIPEGDVTLYAQYAAVHHVTLDANGGYFGDDPSYTSTEQLIMEGEALYGTAPKNHDVHFAFSGWYYDADCTEFAAESNESFTPTEDVTLYAGWTEGWIVTFEAGDGQYNNGSKTSTVTVLKGKPLAEYPYPYMRPLESWFWFDYYVLEDGTRVEACTSSFWDTLNYDRSFIPARDVTLRAHYSHFYNVNFDANGGRFNNDPDNTSMSIRLAESGLNDPGEYVPGNSDPHMAFTGWYYDPDCTNPAAGRDAPVVPHGDMTLYAGWERTYIVTFDAGSGSFQSGETTMQHSVAEGSRLAYSPERQLEAPDHMLFTGWALADGTRLDTWSYIPQGDVTLYAQYVRVYAVTLDANGGYFDDDPANTVKECQVMYGMDLYSPIPTNPNPHLACSGWYYDEACTQLAAGFIDGQYESYTPDSDATLYAGWTEAWVVTFDANGGTLESGNTYSVVKGNRLAYQPFLRPADPNRMRFSHWALADGTRVNNWEYIPEGDVTLYAQYAAVHHVTLDANGGYFGDDPSVTTVVHQITDGEALYSLAPKNPDTHLAFGGWYFDEACTELAVWPNGSFIPDSDVTLYAGWREAWVVTFDANGSSFGSGKTAMEYAVAKGSKLSYDPSPQLIAPDQMRFSYWMLEDGTRVNAWEYIPDGDVTLYARYGRVHHVTLDANGGYFGDDYSTTLERQVTDGQSIILKSPPKNPDPHLACSGWYYDKACTELAAGVVDGAYESFTPENDVTLYAGWDEGWIVTFEAGDGQFTDGTATAAVTVLKGMILEYYPYPFLQPKESYNWFDFYVREDGTRFEYCRSSGWGTGHYSRTFVPEGDMTLYAHYSHFYNVTFDANGGYFPDDPNLTTLGGLMAESGANDPGEYMPKHSNPHMVFDGWYYDAACTNPAAARGEPVAPHGDVTFYALWLAPDLVLPASLTAIEAEAFNGGAFTYVLVPAGVETIGSGSFANCPNLRYVKIQGANTAISDNAFGGRTDFTIIAPAGSAAATWANQHGVNFIPAA